jgi:hypothetical protein
LTTFGKLEWRWRRRRRREEEGRRCEFLRPIRETGKDSLSIYYCTHL